MLVYLKSLIGFIEILMIFNMFNFFNKKYKKNLQELIIVLHKTLLKHNTLESLKLIEALEKGLILSIKEPQITKKYSFFKLGCDMDLVNEYQDINLGQYSISGVKIFDKITNSLKGLEIIIFNGIIMGITFSDKTIDFDIDSSRIDLSLIFKKESDENISIIKELQKVLTLEECALLNNKDLYKITIENNLFYHLRDLEDGNFIGIDSLGKIYMFCHNPFEIKKIEKSIYEIFSDRSNW